MTLSELAEAIAALAAEHGDLPVYETLPCGKIEPLAADWAGTRLVTIASYTGRVSKNTLYDGAFFVREGELDRTEFKAFLL